MDADLRFALEHCLESDIIQRCLVYIHKVINAKGQRPKTPKNSEPMAPLEVIHLFFFLLTLIASSTYSRTVISYVMYFYGVEIHRSCMHASPHNLMILKC